MTIAEKSTELGINLAQIALDNYGVQKCLKNGVFHCFCTKGGKETNIYILDDNGVKIGKFPFNWDDNTLAENSTLAEVETAFKAYLDAQEFNPVDTTVVTYEDLV